MYAQTNLSSAVQGVQMRCRSCTCDVGIAPQQLDVAVSMLYVVMLLFLAKALQALLCCCRTVVSQDLLQPACNSLHDVIKLRLKEAAPTLRQARQRFMKQETQNTPRAR